MKVPCKGCDTRYVGCHGHCSAYITYRSVLDKQNHEQNEIKSANEYQSANFRRIQHRMRKVTYGCTVRN